MQNQQYVTITHYKEREFYFLNYAIQTNDGFIAKEIEQFHESEKDNFIERIRELQTKYPKNQIISLSLAANQVVKEEDSPNQASARIFNDNYVIQEKIDIGNIPVTLYFSPFAILYEEYKNKLTDHLTLIIGLFDRKLYIMFATEDKIHESWTIGTRGLTEKQVGDRVYKSMKAYYKISYKFADNIEMLVSDDSPKLLKVLREELSMSILPTQKTIHSLLHHMGANQSRFASSYIKSYIASSTANSEQSVTATKTSSKNEEPMLAQASMVEDNSLKNLNDINLNKQRSNSLAERETDISFIDKLKSIFASKTAEKSIEKVMKQKPISLLSFVPLLVTLGLGGFFTLQNAALDEKMKIAEFQSFAQSNNALLSMTSQDIFAAMGKSAELKSAMISTDNIELKGVVWGIEPLRNALNTIYKDGDFVIKPLENFMTEFSFKSKV